VTCALGLAVGVLPITHYTCIIIPCVCSLSTEPSPGLNRRCTLLRSEIPSGICAKLRTVAASNNRVHMPGSLYHCLFAPHICMVPLFTHIRSVANHTINATPPERLQQLMFSGVLNSTIWQKST